MDKTVPAPAARLLDFIGGIEAPRGYETIYGNNQDKLTKPITRMTVDELLENQSGFTKAFRSSASGRYQFMRATLDDLKKQLGLRGGQIFDSNLQDRLGYHLLRRRGYDKWIAGEMSDAAFMLGLAKEWASFPVPASMPGAHRTVERGQSYYAGDGVNKALVSPEKVESILKVAKSIKTPIEPLEPLEPLEPIEPVEPVTPIEPTKPAEPISPVIPPQPLPSSRPSLKALLASFLAGAAVGAAGVYIGLMP